MIYHGDCVEVMATLEAESIDAIVTDPPYNLNFMSKAWDRDFGHDDWCREAFRVAKPGAHLLAFSGTRTDHHLKTALEKAGWEIRDTLVWAYASGFPKSLDVSKALDKAAGADRSVTSKARGHVPTDGGNYDDDGYQCQPEYERRDAPATDLAKQWQGWGTALKPAWEPIVLARKPLIGSVAANVTAYSTGALNIDGTRIGVADGHGGGAKATSGFVDGYEHDGFTPSSVGRWPANVVLTDPIFDGGVHGVVGGGDAGKAGVAVNRNRPEERSTYEASAYEIRLGPGPDQTYGDSGTYSRFFRLPEGGRSGMLWVCQSCGVSIAESSSDARSSDDIAPPIAATPPPEPSVQLALDVASQSDSPGTDTAPSPVATTPDGKPASTASVAKSRTDSDTSATEPSTSPEGQPATTRRSRKPASPAEQPPTSTGTMTTTTSPSLCGPCAEGVMRGSIPPPPTLIGRVLLPVELPNYPRFYLCPKAARADREPALRGQVETKAPRGAPIFQTHCTKCGRQKVAPPGSACQCAEPEWSERGAPQNPRANFHPTVKPTELMRHLVRLVTPPGGVVLDPFLGSGTTAIAAEQEGFAWIGIEKEAEYVAIAEARLNGVQRGLGLDFGAPDEAA